VDELGFGQANQYLRVRAALAPDTTYVLSGTVAGAARELTRFTTAAAGATGGTAPVAGKLRLWQVHYTEGAPSHACAQQDHEGYIDLPYTPGSIAGTPPDEVINVVTLGPKAGGQKQTFVFTGSKPMLLTRVWSSFGPGVVEESLAEFPSPIFSPWKPTLDPTLEYCATLTIFGRNDQEGAPLTSETVCAPVTRLATDGKKAVPVTSPPSVGQTTTPDQPPAGGCSVGGGQAASPLFLLGLVAVVLGLRTPRRTGDGNVT
jgi:hypothetical protein